MWIQIVVSLFIMYAIARVAQNFQSQRFTLSASIFWLAVWVSIAFVFWMPDSASRLAFMFGIGRGADLVVYSAIIVLVYLAYRLFARIEHLERAITKLTRAVSLRDATHEKNNRTDPDHQS